MAFSIILLLSIAYLAIIFFIAFKVDRISEKQKSIFQNPYVYALSFAVYCTAWTFYGSVGRAANQGIDFITTYLGPTIMAPIFWFLLRKMIRISRVQKINNLADFVAARFGKDINLGRIIAIFLLIGITPYIAIQIKAISSSMLLFSNISSDVMLPFYANPALYITILCGFIILFFSNAKSVSSGKNPGLIGAVAFESVVKLIAFLILGVFVTYGLFNGFGDVFNQASSKFNLAPLFQIQNHDGYTHWFWMLFLSFSAVLLLPRQFQVAVVENYSENHLRKAMWLFPLYLLLINLFVIPIALGGKVLLPEGANADSYVLALPMLSNNYALAALVFIGGFSAATGMIIVSTLAMSQMLSHNLLLPLAVGSKYVQGRFEARLDLLPAYIKRISIIIILSMAYVYFELIAAKYSLVSIGIISFAAVAQLMPVVIGGMFWKRATKIGAMWGLLVGFGIWFYTLVVPTMVNTQWLDESLLTDGPMGISFLKPEMLFGTQLGDNISNAAFWSIMLNTLSFVSISLFTTQSSIEHNQAEVFVDVFKYSNMYERSVLWKGVAYLPDIKSLLVQFMGSTKAEIAMEQYYKKYPDLRLATNEADPTLVNYAEKLLTGMVGAASARILVSNVVKEENFSVDDVMNMLKESQAVMNSNAELTTKTLELKHAKKQLEAMYESLKVNDKLKDEFLYTVTHEMRTPLTSIKALSEIVRDHDDLGNEQRQQFLQTIVNETDRMTRLISQVLDLEKFETGSQKLNLSEFTMQEALKYCQNSFVELANQKSIKISFDYPKNLRAIYGDKDRIIQVLYNLVANAINHVDANEGVISVSAYQINGHIHVNVRDNGKGVDPQFQQLIFEKFFQAKDQTRIKPKGSGLGLAISKRIVELHEGKIWVEPNQTVGAKFSFTIPYKKPFNT